ncbi:uncharacterized protein LOC105849747 isoform X5 [Hydra vulgaris]|uniref:uncharacterized protein LOC105849747 isoform X5 n=1 Tax=Hydra vulgaris TaxID=6087 RepID=UPI001F5FBE76|nr:uncharacterized protein LOC105849747 isoform X5 [Hydra vulgaris]
MASKTVKNKLLWTRVVWEEKVGSQFEDVIPAHWVNENKCVVFWSSTMSAQRAILEQISVDKTWRKFKWIKTKIVDEDKQLCLDYNFTSGAEQCSSEEEIGLENAAGIITSVEPELPKPPIITFKENKKNEAKDLPIAKEEIINFVASKDNKDEFSMSEEKYRKQSLKLLIEIRDGINRLLNTPSVSGAINIVKVNDISELYAANDELKDAAVRRNAIEMLKCVGGNDCGEMVRNILDRLFSISVMSKMNMKGSSRQGEAKIAFKNLEFFSLIQEVVTRQFNNVSTKALTAAIGNKLKNAPGQLKRDQASS